MIAIFTNPRPFKGEFNIIQRNAILSWLRLKDIEVFLFNDEEGTARKICKEYGLKYISSVCKNKNGTPLIGNCLERVRNKSSAKIIAQVNSDIILCNDFVDTIKKIDMLVKDQKYYVIGQRINIDNQLYLTRKSLTEASIKKLKKSGKLHPPSGMDYWVFPRKIDIKIPAFVAGRPGIDSWLIKYFKQKHIPIIDATNSITALHQEHSYPAKQMNFFRQECNYNLKLAGGGVNMMSIREADYIFNYSKNKFEQPKGIRLILARLSKYRYYGYVLNLYRFIKRNIKK
jgi:hypothetical protein